MGRQFFTCCKRCGKMILLTQKANGEWVPCDPEVYTFEPAGGPSTFITPEGERVRGRMTREGDRHFGYQLHRRTCTA